jgi:hypothetical protein
VGVLEYALSLTRDLAHSWPRGPHQYYLCATPPSEFKLLIKKRLKARIKETENRECIKKPLTAKLPKGGK